VITAYVIRRDLVSVEGPEAAGYLQGQVSQDVEALAPGESRFSFVLQPDGKVDSWVRLTRLGGEEFLLDVDEGGGEALQGRLRRFLLRTKAKIEPWPAGEHVCVAFRGPGAAELDGDGLQWGSAFVRHAAAGSGGEALDVIGPTVAQPDEVRSGTPDEYEAVRIMAGMPKHGAELTSKTIPAEVGEWIVDASVSFTKGCFTGQELAAFGLPIGLAYIGAYLLIIAWLIGNWKVPGLQIATIGIVANTAAIVLNAGQMPIWSGALLAAGFDADEVTGDPFHFVLVTDTVAEFIAAGGIDQHSSR
jgi:folate-binding protein YgfZ